MSMAKRAPETHLDGGSGCYPTITAQRLLSLKCPVPGRRSPPHCELLRKDIHIFTMDRVTEVLCEANRSAFIFKNKYSGQASMRAVYLEAEFGSVFIIDGYRVKHG